MSRKLPWTTLHSFNAQLCVTQSSSSSQYHLCTIINAWTEVWTKVVRARLCHPLERAAQAVPALWDHGPGLHWMLVWHPYILQGRCLFAFNCGIKIDHLQLRLLRCVWRLTVTPTGGRWPPQLLPRWLPPCFMARDSSLTTSPTFSPAWTRMERELSTATTLLATQKGLIQPCLRVTGGKCVWLRCGYNFSQVWIQGRRKCSFSSAAPSWQPGGSGSFFYYLLTHTDPRLAWRTWKVLTKPRSAWPRWLKNTKKDIQLKSSSQAINIIHDVFISAAEREIHTGDGISLKVVVTMFLHRSYLEL